MKIEAQSQRSQVVDQIQLSVAEKHRTDDDINFVKDQFQNQNSLIKETSFVNRIRLSRFVQCLCQQKAKVTYFFIILFMITYRFYSNDYYNRNLICKLYPPRLCIFPLVDIQLKSLATYSYLILTDAFIFVFSIHALKYKKTYRIVPLLSIAQNIFFFYSGTFQLDLVNLTAAVKLIHIFVVFGFILLYLLFRFAKYCFKKRPKLTTVAIISLIIFFYLRLFQPSCQFWSVGLNGEIQNKEGSCKLQTPDCFALRYIFNLDLDFILHNCFLGQKYKKDFDKQISYDIKNGTIVGFSDLKSIPDNQRIYYTLKKAVYQSAKRYETIDQAKKMQHQIIFDTVNQQYHIQVILNKTLQKQNKELYHKYQNSSSPPLVKNVLLIFLDSISRFQSRFKMPKFVNWFQKQSKYRSYSQKEPQRSQDPKQNTQSYEFYKYHSLGYLTRQNVQSHFYGISQQDAIKNPTKSGYQSFKSEYSKRGFVTGFSASVCSHSGADLYLENFQYFQNPSSDHQAFGFNCDPNFAPQPLEFHQFKNGNSAITDRCLYHKTIAEYSFQYTTKFFDKYKNSSKFYQIKLIQGHSYFGGGPRFIDNHLTQMLQELQSKGHLEDTLVVAFSDHGMHRGFNDINHYQPLLYLRIPQKMNIKYRESIRLNQQNLITGYNIYHFLKHVAIGDQYVNKKLGLMGDLSFQTNCTIAKIPTINYTYNPHICTCK